jgi:hypothetical protein
MHDARDALISRLPLYIITVQKHPGPKVRRHMAEAESKVNPMTLLDNL